MSIHHLLITTDFPPRKGGISSYLKNLWDHAPFERSVYVTEETKLPITSADYPIEYSSFFSAESAFYRKMRTLLTVPAVLLKCRGRRDIMLHCGQAVSIGLACVYAKKLLGIPYVVYTYGAEINYCSKSPARTRLLKKVLRHAERVVTISGFTENLLLRYGCPPEKILMLTPGVDAAPAVSEVALKKWRRIFKGQKVILSAGRLVERKGFQTVLQALPEVLKAEDSVLCVFAGDGPYRPELEKMAEASNVEDHVLFAGRVSDEDLAALYQLCHLFIMLPFEDKETMDVEGFGIVYLEANRVGKPVIGSKSGGIAAAIKEGVSGQLIEPRDPEAAGETILKLLGDPGLSEKMGEKGKERVEKDFRWADRGKGLAEEITNV